MRTCGRHRRRTLGFTLIELMIVVAIIGLLAAIAVPGFTMMRAKARCVDMTQSMATLARGIHQHWYEKGRWPGFDPQLTYGYGDYNPITTTPLGQEAPTYWTSRWGWDRTWLELAQYGFATVDRSRGRYLFYGTATSGTLYAQHDCDSDGVVGWSYVMWTVNGGELIRRNIGWDSSE